MILKRNPMGQADDARMPIDEQRLNDLRLRHRWKARGRTLVSETVLSDVWNPFQDIPLRCGTAALKSFRRRALPAEAGAAQPDESEKWDAHFRTDFALEKGSQAGSSGLLCSANGQFCKPGYPQHLHDLISYKLPRDNLGENAHCFA